jgi:hypothetical protein
LEALKTLRTDIEEERKEVPGADGKPTALDTALKAVARKSDRSMRFRDTAASVGNSSH